MTPVTALQGRAFGIWTLITAAVRFQAAYNTSNKPIYQLALFTYAAASVHFVLELFWFRTMTWRSFGQSGGEFDIATTVWMAAGWLQNSYF